MLSRLRRHPGEARNASIRCAKRPERGGDPQRGGSIGRSAPLLGKRNAVAPCNALGLTDAKIRRYARAGAGIRIERASGWRGLDARRQSARSQASPPAAAGGARRYSPPDERLRGAAPATAFDAAGRRRSRANRACGFAWEPPQAHFSLDKAGAMPRRFLVLL